MARGGRGLIDTVQVESAGSDAFSAFKLFESASQPADRSADPSEFIEREIRFFCRRDQIESHLALDSLPSCEVVQHYFKRELVPLVAPFVLEMRGLSSFFEAGDFTQARLRKVEHEVGDVKYFLAVKGPYLDRTSGERNEIPVEVSESMYRSLLGLASGGALQKVRYHKEGVIYGADGREHLVIAEIDVPFAAGKDPRRLRERDVDFVFVDIELSCPSLLKPLRAGRHNLTFLNGAIDMTLIDEEFAAALSSKRLAKKGFDQKAKTAVRALLDQFAAA